MVNLTDNFYYCESSPSGLRRKHNRMLGKSVVQHSGDVAGSLNKKTGYWQLSARGKKLLGHRIVWELHNGEIPDDKYVDHINGNRSDNKVINLRLVTPKISSRNRGISSLNKSGKTGVARISATIPSGKVYEYWSGTMRLGGKTVARRFSIEKYGDAEAFRLACIFRDNLMALSGESSTYTDRHKQIKDTK